MRFNEYFVDLVNKSELKQASLAQKIGISQSQISRYLGGVIPDIKNCC